MNTTAAAHNSGMNVGNANSNPTLTRKLDKLFDMKLDQPELVESLKYLDNFYGKNSLTARRNLRGQIEKEGLQIHNDFLQALMVVQKNLEEVQNCVSEMKRGCTEMNSRLEKTKDISGKLLQQVF